VPRAHGGVPVTVHVAVGTDTVHMHPSCDGAALGAATHRDFRRLASWSRAWTAASTSTSAPRCCSRVFLKAVAIVHNANGGKRVSITTGNLDFLKHYRPG